MCVVRGNVVCGAHSLHVTRVAQEMRVEGEALRAGLVRELLVTLLKGGEMGERKDVRLVFLSKVRNPNNFKRRTSQW